MAIDDYPEDGASDDDDLVMCDDCTTEYFMDETDICPDCGDRICGDCAARHEDMHREQGMGPEPTDG